MLLLEKTLRGPEQRDFDSKKMGLVSILNAQFINRPVCRNRPIQNQSQMEMNCPKMAFNLIKKCYGGVTIRRTHFDKINSIRNVHIKCVLWWLRVK